MRIRRIAVLVALASAIARPAHAATAATADNVETLVAEAMRQSPLVAAARSHWQAQDKVPIQVSTLPDPEVSLQHFTVGSPQPFSGYETSDFYYTGFGAMQEIPGPGKLKLRGIQAGRDTDVARAQYEAAQRSVAEKVREACANLFYFGKASALLERSRIELQQIERITEDGYRAGRGSQQDVVKAQLEITAMLREIEMNREQAGEQQAGLKAILGRDTDSRDIQVADVQPAEFAVDAQHARALAAAESPALRMAQAMASRSKDSLDLAHNDYVPDFSLGYMYQKTGPHMRDYYMLTLGAKVPLYFWRKQTPAVEQAALEKEAAAEQLRAARLDTLSGVDRQIVAIRTSDRIITLYRDGLIPQSEATRAAAYASYASSKVDFQTLLSAVIDSVNLNQEYFRAVADREIAIAKLKEIIGDQS
ncbi:MAG TPA: TolC family protein [Candidatus Acidoferrales bacterium]|nr:TolC family protein [Candidatus Acidoferrales bacterium]